MFHQEKLTVYQRALAFAVWSQTLIHSNTKKTSTRDHLERAGDSIGLNIGEGNGKFSQRDRARFFQSLMARHWSLPRVWIFLSRGDAAKPPQSSKESNAGKKS